MAEGIFFNSHGWIILSAAAAIALLFIVLLPFAARLHPLPPGRLLPMVIIFPWAFLALALLLSRRYAALLDPHSASSNLLVAGAAAAMSLPVALFYCRRAATNVPVYLRETARLEGASNWQLFSRVFIPLAWLDLLAGFLVAETQLLAAILLCVEMAPQRRATSPPSINFEIGLVALLLVSTLLSILVHGLSRSRADTLAKERNY